MLKFLHLSIGLLFMRTALCNAIEGNSDAGNQQLPHIHVSIDVRGEIAASPASVTLPNGPSFEKGHATLTHFRHNDFWTRSRKRDVSNTNNTNSNSSSSNTSEEELYEDEDEEQRYLDEIKDYISPKSWTWVLIGCHVIVFIVGLLGNLLVCIAVYRNYSMRTVTNYFIVNLAVADFLVILFCLPPSVIWDVTSTWFFGTFMCKTVLYFQTVSVTVSVLTLTLISIDRWYAICHPLKFKSTTRRAATAIIVIWIVALTLDIPELVVYTTKPYENHQIETIYFTQCNPTWSNNTETAWTVSKAVLLYALPLLFMMITYVQIIRVLWKSGNVSHRSGASGNRQRISFSMVSNSSTKGQLRSRKKVSKMLVCVVCTFAICYFPVHLLSVLRLIFELKNNQFNKALAMISHWLCYANSALNPIIYNFMSGKFREEFKRTMKCSTLGLRDTFEMNTLKRSKGTRTTACTYRSDTAKTTLSID